MAISNAEVACKALFMGVKVPTQPCCFLMHEDDQKRQNASKDLDFFCRPYFAFD